MDADLVQEIANAAAVLDEEARKHKTMAEAHRRQARRAARARDRLLTVCQGLGIEVKITHRPGGHSVQHDRTT